MTSITTRVTAASGATVKGAPLTNAEVDQNFIALNNAKVETSNSPTAGKAIVHDGTNPVWKELTLEDLPGAWAKRTVRVATTANITLSGTQTIDGVAVVAGDRVLVKDQTTASQNGIYVVAAGAWARSTDADTADKIAAAVVPVDSGTVNGGGSFDSDFKSTDTLGTTAMNFYRVLDSNSPVLNTPTINSPYIYRSTAATITAGTNAQGQGALTNDINVITTAAANPSGVTLPTAAAGRGVLVINKGANPVNVYPATGGIIDGLAANASVQLPVGGVLQFFATSTTQWYSSQYEATQSGALTNTNANALSTLQTGVGLGFANMVVLNTVSSNQTWTVPANVKRFKVTVIGGGGGGATTAATAAQVGGGGGSGGATVSYYNFASGVLTGTYTVGGGGAAATAGGASSFSYNGVSQTSNGGGGGVNIGAGGAGGTVSGAYTLGIVGAPGAYGGVQAATTVITGMGADTPLGFGFGGLTATAAAGSNGLAAVGYGAGGSGGINGSAATARTGGAGSQGIVIIEY